MAYDSLWIEDSQSPKLGKKIRSTFTNWKKQTQNVKPSISTRSISSPFGFQHVCHMDTKTVFGVEQSLHLADKAAVTRYLPEGNNFLGNSADEEGNEELDETYNDEFNPTTLDPGPLKAFSFNKTTPTKLSSALSSTSLATKLNHRRTTSSLSSLSVRNSSTFTRMSYQSANSNDCASPLELKRPLLPAIPQDNELNEVLEEDDDDDYTYKFQTIPIAPKPPSTITELKLEDIPCDSDNESIDIQLEKCHLALEKLDTEFVPSTEASERDTGVMEIIFRHSKMILRDNNNQKGDIINLLEQLDPDLTKELQEDDEDDEEETDFFGDLGLDDSISDTLSGLDIINMNSYADPLNA